jgi:hypothetical protein
MIDQQTVKNLFYYDAESGMLFWRNGNGRNVKPWQQAKSSNGHGYYTAKINKKTYLVHRLAWLYVFGETPKYQIDHINGIKDDNRIVNLRQATHAENQQNKHSTKGYSWHQKRQVWEAYIRINGKKSTLGYFEKEEDAQLARTKAKHKHHPFFTSSR